MHGCALAGTAGDGKAVFVTIVQPELAHNVFDGKVAPGVTGRIVGILISSIKTASFSGDMPTPLSVTV